MDDPHIVQILDGIQDLVDELAGISLCVEAFLYDPVEQLATGNTENQAALNRGCVKNLKSGEKILCKHRLLFKLTQIRTGNKTR